MSNRATIGKVVGIFATSIERPAFAEPLFRCEGLNGLFVQSIDPMARRVTHFAPLADGAVDVPFDGPVFEAGGEPLLAIVDGQGEVWAGLSNDLRTSSPLASDARLSRSLQFQIADALNDEARKGVLREQIEHAIASVSNKTAVGFELSYARAALWDSIFALSSTISADLAARDVIESADVERNGDKLTPQIGVKLSTTLGEEALKAVIRLFEQKTRRSRQSDLFGYEVRESGPTTPDGPEISGAIRQVRQHGRQEERLAEIMSIMIDDPAVGMALMNNYRDNAGFANSALNHLRSHIIETDGPEDIRLLFARSIPKIVSLSFPMNRGVLLLALAIQLGKYPEIESAIRGRLREISSMAVNQYRRAIEQELDSSRTAAG